MFHRAYLKARKEAERRVLVTHSEENSGIFVDMAAAERPFFANKPKALDFGTPQG